MNAEEALTEIAGKAALLRYLASSATINPEPPDRTALDGMSDVCDDIQALTRAIKAVLPVDAMVLELKRRR